MRLAAFLLIAATAPARAQGASPARIAASVVRVFGGGAAVAHVRADTTDVMRITRADSLLGFAVVRDFQGKEQPITVLVATDPADHLKDVDVLVYREPYGGEVAYDSWRRQFRGRSAADSLAVGRDIRGISGATISVNAVTLGVRDALRELTRWHRSGVIR